ncbi:MAG: hypothetical protein PHS92_05125 [Candidatus Gracilibacteria bacterium]|nr:hypothetical protein [Candidatus Gracilibacteria bacterium]
MINSKFNSICDYSSFIFILGGAFQGKSILSIKTAERYTFSTVLSTDCFRNFLRINNPTEAILCSTSKLDVNIFNKQREEISDLLFNILKFYADRKEKVIIEGIHFSKDFLEFAIKNGAKCLCLNNKIPWKEKVSLKKITTPITRIIDKKTGKESYIEHTDNLNIDDISYTHKEKDYTNIHNIIISDANSLKICNIAFNNINDAFLEICVNLDKYFL